MRLIHSLILLPMLFAMSVPAASGTLVESFRNAELHELEPPRDLVSAVHDLARALGEAAWVGYAVPRVPGGPGLAFHGDADDDHGRCGTYYLEDRSHETRHFDDAETSGRALVLLRIDGGDFVRITAVDVECTVDAGGLPVHFFTGVDPRQSLDLLASVATGAERRSLAHAALHAIAVHDEPAVDALLERVATGELDWSAEDQAVFWLGAARGQRGFEVLRRLARQDDPRLRKHVTFALHVSDVAEAVDVLVDMARHDTHADVRRQALFWLAHEAGRRAVSELERAAEEDPDVEVKKHAVFAISRLPAGEGVPLLIRYARTHSVPAVRKQAIFWLGQSDDERALDFFEDVLLDREP